jgi:hypothetical protein
MQLLNPFTTFWFWLLIFSIVGFIVSIIFYETSGQTATGNTSTPGWIWTMFIISIFLFVLSFILYWLDLRCHCYEGSGGSCGNYLKLPNEKTTDCPKQECDKKKIINYSNNMPKNKLLLQNTKSPDESYEQITNYITIDDISEDEEDDSAPPGFYPLGSLSPLTTNVQI